MEKRSNVVMYVLLFIIFVVFMYVANWVGYEAGRHNGYLQAERDMRYMQRNAVVYDRPMVNAAPVIEAGPTRVTYNPSDADNDYETIIEPEMMEAFKEYRKSAPLAPFGPWHDAWKELEEQP